MFLISLLLSLIMLGFGAFFCESAPKKINPFFGYKTTMSMKNQDTWSFAHKYVGRIWLVCGLGMLLITIVAMLVTFRMDEEIVRTVGIVLDSIQMILLIGPIIPTEIALHKTFDKDGNRR